MCQIFTLHEVDYNFQFLVHNSVLVLPNGVMYQKLKIENNIVVPI